MSEDAIITPKAKQALMLLRGTSPNDTISASALAARLWPDRYVAMRTSLRRGGLYRAAGSYYSSLQKKGWVGHWMDEFTSGYYLTQLGQDILRRSQ